MDGELVCRFAHFVLDFLWFRHFMLCFRCSVLQLMNLTDSRLQVTGGCEKLELAMLSFFEQFRKIYVGDQVILLSA